MCNKQKRLLIHSNGQVWHMAKNKLDHFLGEGVRMSKIGTSKGQNIESFFRIIRTSKVKKITTSKV
jgi:hypothetical protein